MIWPTFNSKHDANPSLTQRHSSPRWWRVSLYLRNIDIYKIYQYSTISSNWPYSANEGVFHD